MMDTDYTVMVASSLHYPAIVECMRELAAYEGGACQLTVESLLKAQNDVLSPPLLIYVAVLKEEVVGCIIAYSGFDVLSASRGMHLSDLYVLPHARRAGIATALMERLCRDVLEQGGEWVSWTVLKNNKMAKRFYQKVDADQVDVDFMALGVSGMKQLCRFVKN
jgi:ribosomal protein S18 acetylase RimI-like enzyme